MRYAAFDMSNLMHIALYSKFRQDPKDPYPIITSMLDRVFKFLDDVKVDVPFFVFDSKFSYKKMIYKDIYKQGRNKNETPQAKAERLSALQQLSFFRTHVLSALDLNQFRIMQTGFEADDMMALLANKYKEDLVIVSTDTDFYQLLDRASRIYNPLNLEWKDQDMVFLTKGVRAYDWAKYRSLVGKSQEIDGVPGIGPKTASAYLAGDKVSKTVLQKIKDHKDLLDRNLLISTLPFECAFPIRPLPDNKDLYIKDKRKTLRAMQHFSPSMVGPAIYRPIFQEKDFS